MRNAFFFIAAAGMLALVPVAAFAAQILPGGDYTLSPGETVSENLYIGGGNITIAGTVEGDLVIGGGNIMITGTVERDLLVGGGDVNIEGDVGGNVRMGGGLLAVLGNVGGDILMGGGELRIAPGGVVGQDVILGGGELTVDGVVEGNARVNVGEVIVNGEVFGTIERGGEGIMQNIARVGALFPLMAFVASLVLGLVIFYFFGDFTRHVTGHALQNPGRDLLRGFLISIGIPLLIVVSFVTVIGFMVGIFLTFLFIVLLILAQIFAGIVAGTWIMRVVRKQDIAAATNVGAVVLGILIVSLLGYIPIIGWLFILVLAFLALGGVVSVLFRRLQPA